MSVHYRTQAFVLAKSDQGEADQVFLVFSQGFGSLQVLGRATRKIVSKLRAGIPVFSVAEIAFVQGKAHKTLTDTVLIKDFLNIKKDLQRLGTAYRIGDVFSQLVKPPQKDEKIWQLLNETFRHLDNYSLFITHYSLLYDYFLWNLLVILGHKPELYECLVCRKKLEPKNLYFSERGGILCAACRNRIKQEIPQVDPNVVKILREILKMDYCGLLKIKIESKHRTDLEKISDFYASAVIAQN